jgi:heterodisulfide reductase subunit D
LFDLNQEIIDTKVRLCLDCGKCTVVCPVSQYDSDFNPRLIIQKRLGQKIWDLKDESIWSCLNCQMCYERCNYKVKFPEFVNALRAEAVHEGAKVQCSHGGTLQSIMHLMANVNTKQQRLDWLPEDISLTEQSDTRFFVGCAPYFDVIFKDLGVKSIEGVIGALRLLNKANVPFNLLANERCCGRDLLLQGDREGFQELVRINTSEFTKHGVKKIITYCPECYTCLKLEYPKIVGDECIEVVNFFNLISPLLKNNNIFVNRINKRVTYQDPCSLGRGFQVFDTPRQLLATVPGVHLVEMENNRENSLCCGANPWAYCSSINRQIQEKRLGQAASISVELLLTACPKCQIHLKCAQNSDGCEAAQIEIQDFARFVAGALNRR